MNLLFCIAVLLLAAPFTGADVSPQSTHDTQAWGLSMGQVVKDQQDDSFIRLDLKADHGLAQVSNAVPLEAGCAYELKIEYRSNNAISARDKGSWIYLAFRDAGGKTVGDQCQLLDRTGSWQSKSIELKPPIEAANLYMSFRQQQQAGTTDIKSIELRRVDPDGNAVMTLSPEALSALHWVLEPGQKLNPDGEASSLTGNIFQPYLKGKAPKVVRNLGSEIVDGVQLHKVVFRSMTVGGDPQDVYAVIARPIAEGNYPGILWLHGGYGCAEPQRAIRFAKAGYVTISTDLPGIGDPKKCPDSVGPWAYRFAKVGLTVKPDPTADGTFDAVVAALQAFDLLCAQPGVIKDRVGVTGISMGGYSTTMIAGLLGKRVRAAYSIFGCGFYERGSAWSAALHDMTQDERQAWLRNFDAGRRASGIKAPYFIAAAARDHFFWPPAVNSTVSAIPAGSNQAYAPEISHNLKGIPASDNLDLLYLGYWLKGEGSPFPKVTIESCQPQTDGSRLVTFSVQAPLPVQTATLYVTAGAESWEKGTWEPIAAQEAGVNRYQATIPADKINKNGAWYVNVSDARPATVGSLVYGMEAIGNALQPLGVTSVGN